MFPASPGSTSASPRLDAEIVRFEDAQPIHVGSGRLCGGYIVFGCLDGRVVHADLPFGSALPTPGTFDGAVSIYAGATIGIGYAFAADGISALVGL